MRRLFILLRLFLVAVPGESISTMAWRLSA